MLKMCSDDCKTHLGLSGRLRRQKKAGGMNLPVFTLSRYRLRMTSGQRQLRRLTEVGLMFSLGPMLVGDMGTSLSEPYFCVQASDEIKDAARAWIDKLCVKNGAYPPDSYPNPGKPTKWYRYLLMIDISCGGLIFITSIVLS